MAGTATNLLICSFRQAVQSLIKSSLSFSQTYCRHLALLINKIHAFIQQTFYIPNPAMTKFLLSLFFVLILLFTVANSEDQDVIMALVVFMGKLAPRNVQRGSNWGWNGSSDPCTNKWEGITCDNSLQFVKKIVLDETNLTGVLDAQSLCQTSTLLVLSLAENDIVGDLEEDISGCKNLTHLYLGGNRFSGTIPSSISELNNLKRFNVSYNSFTGKLPDMSNVTGLLTFLAENNQFSGEITQMDFSNLQDYNVSNNKLIGPIPNTDGRFNNSSFSGNSGLCGMTLSNICPNVSPQGKKSKGSSIRYLIYSGSAVLSLVTVLALGYTVVKKVRSNDNKADGTIRGVRRDGSSATSTEFKNGGNRSEFSLTSAETGNTSSSLVVVSTPLVNGLRFEDLLKAPAELLGRGKHGSLYKVQPDGGLTMVVKRIKEWPISKDDFKMRMQRVGQVMHPKVLQILAYYCSKEEKLLVYEYKQNGSLFQILHGSQNGQMFNWGSRLNMAATIAEALAFMHDELGDDGIPHGNLKSSNILLNKEKEACISEYGLMLVNNQPQTKPKINDTNGGRALAAFRMDIYSFGEILMELLTGKLVQNTGPDLAKWVHSVVKEEWTGEVFDKYLISEGASEERLVNLLQVAFKCINASPDSRPNMKQVSEMINSIKEEEENSISL